MAHGLSRTRARLSVNRKRARGWLRRATAACWGVLLPIVGGWLLTLVRRCKVPFMSDELSSQPAHPDSNHPVEQLSSN